MTSTSRVATDTQTSAPTRNRAYSILVGLTTLAIFLQAVWAGLFVHEGEDYRDNWVAVHARGADVAILLAAAATVVALIKLRSRLDLVVGSIALTVLLILEAFLGGLIGDHAAVTVIHFPLAMALLALAVWLPMRAVRR